MSHPLLERAASALEDPSQSRLTEARARFEARLRERDAERDAERRTTTTTTGSDRSPTAARPLAHATSRRSLAVLAIAAGIFPAVLLGRALFERTPTVSSGTSASLPRVVAPSSAERVAAPSVEDTAPVASVRTVDAARTTMDFVVDGAPAAVGDSIDAAGRDTDVRFSDGSVVHLASGARARVTSITPDGATLDLLRGVAQISVVHRERTAFAVQAGPFLVRVTGTRFETRWDPSRDAIGVTMREGRVRISGCGAEEVAVSGTETFEHACREGNLVPARTLPEGTSPPLPPAPQTIPRIAKPTTGARASAGPEGADGTPDRVLPPSELDDPAARARAFLRGEVGAVHAWAAPRFREACTSASTARELYILAESARRTGHRVEATEAWSLLRTRFPTADEARSASFLLGRIAAEGGEASAARDWFARAAVEAPPELRRDAVARWMDAAITVGSTDEARTAARHYLSSWPTGPASGHAKEILGP